MDEKYEVRSLSREDLATFLHGGLSSKQDTTFSREVYLCEAKVYGIRDVKSLTEYISRVSVGDVVRLYRRVYDQLPATLDSKVKVWLDDEHNVRIHTFDGGCLGYMQPPEKYAVADLMLAGQKIYAKVSYVADASMPFDTWEAVKLKVYWVIESNPLSTDLTVFEPEKENEIVIGAFKGDVLLDDLSIDLWPSSEEMISPDRTIRNQERLMVYKVKRGSVEVFLRTMDGAYKTSTASLSETVSNLLDAGKNVYAVVEEIITDVKNPTEFVRTRLKFYLELET